MGLKISKRVVLEIRRLQELEKAHKLLLEEHAREGSSGGARVGGGV